jgi:hypothetical protein
MSRRRRPHPFIMGGRLQIDVDAIIRTGCLREEHLRRLASGYELVERVTVRVRADATVVIPISWRRDHDLHTVRVSVPVSAFFAAAPPPPPAREDAA